MPEVVFLGTAAAIPDENHENTHFALISGQHTILVDSAGSPIVRLRTAGIDPLKVTEIILTHFHPDHTYGLPLLLMDMWLLGRSVSLDIFGLGDTLKRVKTLLDLYGWDKWPGFFPVNFHPLSEEQNHLFLQDDDLRITSSPACHLIPTIALKFDSLRTGKSLAYSCDTEPCQAVIDLACNADILIHESSGESKGHTSPEQAGQIATQAKVGALYLIHYPVGSSYRPDAWIKHAQQSFAGEVVLAQDFMKVEF